MDSFRPPLKHITDAQRLQINMLGRQVTSFIVLELSEMKVSFFFVSRATSFEHFAKIWVM
jgi:hypothetical protein